MVQTYLIRDHCCKWVCGSKGGLVHHKWHPITTEFIIEPSKLEGIEPSKPWSSVKSNLFMHFLQDVQIQIIPIFVDVGPLTDT